MKSYQIEKKSILIFMVFYSQPVALNVNIYAISTLSYPQFYLISFTKYFSYVFQICSSSQPQILYIPSSQKLNLDLLGKSTC